jgi:hypothetical protein
MSSIITDSNDLIAPAHDKFMDGHPTRRELQKAFNKMGNNDSELFSMVDTQALVGNFLCEKLGVTRAELEAYVLKKSEEVKTFHEKQESQRKIQETSNESSNG